MKKILIFIVGIVGIGLSFCSADYFAFDKTFFPNLAGGDFYFDNGSYSYLGVNSIVPNKNIILNKFCYYSSSDFSNHSYFSLISFSYSFDGFSTSTTVPGYFTDSSSLDFSSSLFSTLFCFDFSNLSINSGQEFSYKFNLPNYAFNGTLSNLRFLKSYKGRGANSSYGVFTFGSLLTYFDYTDNFILNYYTYYNSYYYFLTPSYILYTIPADPKFKVNYGNTSYEYTLEDNLEIRLNSPVVKNGDIYSYAGSTGINLFFNGSSQRYSKDKLYLFTPSRYSNNIFNPICL